MMISFIIPAFNAEKTISLCLKSIFAQDLSGGSFEVLVVDNNSNDETVKRAQVFSQVRIIQEAAQGRSYARNAGAKIAAGQYVAFVDADVILETDWAKNLLKAFTRASVGGAQGSIIPSEAQGLSSLNKYRIRNALDSTDGTFSILNLTTKESPMINTAACIYRKDAFEKAGGFDPHLNRHEDIDLSKRVILCGFDLALSLDSKAHVIYNGSGWISYFMRSFEDGYYKGDYLHKWKGWLFTSETAVAESNLRMFCSEVPMNILRSAMKLDLYYSLKAVNSMMKSLGRLVRALKSSTISVFEKEPSSKQAYILQDDVPIIEFDMTKKTVTKIRGLR